MKYSFNNQEEERRRLTLEALADVDASKVIDHAVVLAWAQNLPTTNPYHHPLGPSNIVRSARQNRPVALPPSLSVSVVRRP